MWRPIWRASHSRVGVSFRSIPAARPIFPSVRYPYRADAQTSPAEGPLLTPLRPVVNLPHRAATGQK
jgi:hypothetical protein